MRGPWCRVPGRCTTWKDLDKYYPSAHMRPSESMGGIYKTPAAMGWIRRELAWLKGLNPKRRYRVIYNKGHKKVAIKEI